MAFDAELCRAFGSVLCAHLQESRRVPVAFDDPRLLYGCRRR